MKLTLDVENTVTKRDGRMHVSFTKQERHYYYRGSVSFKHVKRFNFR